MLPRQSLSAWLWELLKGSSGEDMECIEFIIEWGLSQTQGGKETGKGVEGICVEVIIMQSHSTCSGQRLMPFPLYIFEISWSSGSS